MNSIPKQQEGDGSDAAAANGSRATLEQTVLGVSPPAPAAAPAEPGSGAATSEEPLPATPSGVIVAAPVIAVSSSGAATPSRPDEPRDSAAQAVSAPEAAASSTLLVDSSASSAPERPFTTPRYGTPTPGGPDGQQSTVLNDDYLRVAREAAFAHAVPAGAARPARGEAHSPAVGARPAEENTSASTATTRPSMAPPSWAAALPGSSDEVGSSTIRGFEPVPVLRAPLAESLSGGLMAVSELGGKGLSRGARPLPRPRPPRADVKSRWMLLCAVAFAVVGVISFGGRLLNRYRSTTERTRALSAHEAAPPRSEPLPGEGLEGNGAATAGSASRALLANRPASERGLAAGRTTVISASSAPVDVPSPGSAAVASPQSQLAATAGRLMLAGSYAEALPVYRQLAHEWPENTSYAAMARLLEKRIGSMNDTRTIAPATP